MAEVILNGDRWSLDIPRISLAPKNNKPPIAGGLRALHFDGTGN
jgi:hypothetical protein